MRARSTFAVIFAFTLAACGDDDNIADKSLTDLSESEVTTLCEVVIEAQGGPGTVRVCDGRGLTTYTLAECVAAYGAVTNCNATAAQAETCAATAECPDSDSAACVALESCFP